MNGINPIVAPTHMHSGFNNTNALHCQNCGSQPHNIEPSTVASRFLSEYYQNVSHTGWNAVTYLFDSNCTVLCKDKHIGNYYDLLNGLSSEYAKRANYANLRSKWVVTSNDTIVVNVFGTIQFVTFSEHVHTPVTFTETFVLK